MSEIRPALTPDEWQHRVLRELDPGEEWTPYIANMRIEGGKIAVDNSAGEYGQALLDPFKVIALANAALPDDDPRKITRDDVDTLRTMAVHDHEGFPIEGPPDPFLSSLAAKLAALLPP